MPDNSSSIPGISSISNSKAQQIAAQQALLNRIILAEGTEEDLKDLMDDVFNPLLLHRQSQSLEKRVREKSKASTPEAKPEASEEEESYETFAIDKIEEVAHNFRYKNPELEEPLLLRLRSSLHPQDSAEEILAKIEQVYPDPFLAHEALDFCLSTSGGILKEHIQEAKELLSQKHGPSIRAGSNILAQTTSYAKKGVSSPSNLRSLYHNITHSSHSADLLFEQLSTQFPFSKLKSVIDFILHSLGADLKAKGPSISRGELSALFTETRNMQAILWVFRFFHARMHLLEKEFSRQGLTLSSLITFESLAKIFVKLAQERYPTPEKVLSINKVLQLQALQSQLLVLVQMRDATRYVSPRIFKSEKQRQDLLLSCMEALEEIEELLEKEEEENNKKKKNN